jgi:hypothetical protein
MSLSGYYYKGRERRGRQPALIIDKYANKTFTKCSHGGIYNNDNIRPKPHHTNQKHNRKIYIQCVQME